jgi:hypothetical protein
MVAPSILFNPELLSITIVLILDAYGVNYLPITKGATGFFNDFKPSGKQSKGGEKETATRGRIMMGQPAAGHQPSEDMKGNLPAMQTFDDNGYHLSEYVEFKDGKKDHTEKHIDYYLWQHKDTLGNKYRPDPSYLNLHSSKCSSVTSSLVLELLADIS